MPITDYAFEELNDGSGRGFLAEQNQPSEFFRVFKIAWADLAGFLLALRGGWKRINSNTWTYITPDQHPDWGGVYCKDALYEGIGLTSQDPATKKSSWEYAKITARYTSITLDLTDVTKIYEEDFDFGLDIVHLENGSLVEDSGGAAFDGSASLLIPTLTYTVSMPALPDLPGGSINAVMALLGRVNNTSFGGATTGKMLFLGMRASRKGDAILNANSQGWNVQLKFAYRDQHKWNEVCSNGGTFTAVKLASGDPLYSSGNLNLLLPNGT